MKIDAHHMDYLLLNQAVRRQTDSEVEIDHCLGQRFIGTGLANKTLVINGVPGNALGAYLDGGRIIVRGNAQDATGDTMNDGEIIIHGSSGDATGYSMRGGLILVKGNAGYRAGIHMKSYGEKSPVLVVGGAAGSFLGEYQAGGLILVLGIGCEDRAPYGYFCGTGMHGGAIYLRCKEAPGGLPAQVSVSPATEEDMAAIQPYIETFCKEFGVDISTVLPHPFYVLRPNTKNPYKRLYTHN